MSKTADAIRNSAQSPAQVNFNLPPPNGKPTHNGNERAPGRAEPWATPVRELQLKERLLASLSLLIWLNLFAGGIFIDTKPARCAISPKGVAALETQASPNGGGGSPCSDHVDAQGNRIDGTRMAVSWFIALVFFLPLNLALLCATAGVLGTFGNIANLYHDQATLSSQDRTNPYISGLLRGFFVYLFVISGLLVLDDAPFANSSPGQYIRLAGFLSLFSFVVNYQPHIFSMLVDIAQTRISNSKSPSVGVVQSGEDKMATVQGDKVTATENRDGTMTLEAEPAEDK
jgi:hypothetical protein